MNPRRGAENGETGLSLDQFAGSARALSIKPAQILAHADNAEAQLKSKGITVLVGKEAAKDDQNFAYLGAAALGALIGAILAKGK